LIDVMAGFAALYPPCGVMEYVIDPVGRAERSESEASPNPPESQRIRSPMSLE
jgi:hypothetical protein